MNINDYINFEYDFGHKKQADWLRVFIKNEASNIPIIFEEFPIFGNRPAGATSEDGILLNKRGFFNKNERISFKFYVIFHEIGHYLRKSENVFELAKQYIANNDFKSFIKINEREEKFANEYATKISRRFAEDLNNTTLAYKISNSEGSIYLAKMLFQTMRENLKNYNDIDDILIDFMKLKIKPNMNEMKILIKLFENTEVAPAKPKIDPGKVVPKRNPLQIPIKKPDGLPMPRPKAKHKNISLEKYFYSLNERYKFARLINEAPMNFDPENNYKPAEEFQQGIEGKSESPFTNIEFLQKKQLEQSTLEKIGSEEFNEVVKNLLRIGHMQVPAILTTLNSIMMIEKDHRKSLEDLALNSVVKNFGLPDEIKQRLNVSLMDDVEMGVDDEENPIKDAEKLLNPGQKKIAEKLIQKRVVQNALMMGSGYRAHRLFSDIKPAIDNIDRRLYPLYEKVMNNMEFFLWVIKPPKEARIPLGKSEINPDDLSGSAQAKLFLFLLHETAKTAVELLFLQSVFNIAEEHGNEVYDYVLKKSDRYDEEQWMKLIGPRLWKYLHDVINYIVMDRNNDYTIVSFLLNKISLLPPDKFLKLIDEVVNDGPTAIRKLTFMLDEVEKDIEEFEKQNNEAPAPEDIMDEPNLNLMNDLVQQANAIIDRAIPVDNNILNHKPFAEMNVQELQNYINLAVEESEYEKAAEARDELNSRK